MLTALQPVRRGRFELRPNATAQDTHGFTSCSVLTGVPLSLLLKQAGVQAGANVDRWEGSEKGKHTKSIPIEKAMDDVLVPMAKWRSPAFLTRLSNSFGWSPAGKASNNVKWLRESRW